MVEVSPIKSKTMIWERNEVGALPLLQIGESIVVGDQEAVGCRYQVILSRGSSEWIAELSNNH